MTSDNRNYVVKFGDGTFYSKAKSWGGVSESKATWLTHKDACFISNKLNQPRIAMNASVKRLSDE